MTEGALLLWVKQYGIACIMIEQAVFHPSYRIAFVDAAQRRLVISLPKEHLDVRGTPKDFSYVYERLVAFYDLADAPLIVEAL